ncbi:GSCOCT00013120001.2-RA-CDS [Cotesia congregata]|uniref:Cc_bv4.1_16.4 n=2 Tax=root TaxID=1 RepID=S6D301_COTCN|nr:GSCOCT00013120001.2-RA-CDS [Cotesia congregata]CAG5092572.1 cc_bv4.1_16.4 [Cotesia congregata]CCB96381.1 hypotetical protein BV4-1 [Bracoviriform congregatae]CCQ71285.1 hypotetical protein BV4-1 [Cotesia congregata]
MHRPGNYFIPVIEFTSLVDDNLDSLQPPRRRLNRSLVELLRRFDGNSPGVSEPRDQDNSSLLKSEDNVPNLTSTTAVQASRSTTPLVRISTPVDQAQADETDAPVVQHTIFYNWLINAVIFDDLSFRQPFINCTQDANQLTKQDLFLHALDLYHNANQLRPQELVNLPFLPRTMRTGETLLDIPFLDPLLVVLWCIHIDDVHWMLNVLPWRVVDRPIRTGRSILAWIIDIPNIHDFLEMTRAPFTVTVKLIRFLDIYSESFNSDA